MISEHTRADEIAINLCDCNDSDREQVADEVNMFRARRPRFIPPLSSAALFDKPDDVGIKERKRGFRVFVRPCSELRP